MEGCYKQLMEVHWLFRNINELSLEAQLTLANYLMEVKTLKRAPNIRLIMLANEKPSMTVHKQQLHPKFAELVRDNIFLTIPLRQRRDDIAPLAAEYLRLFVKRYRKRSITLSPEATNALQAYSWPGNMNELKSVIERAVLIVGSDQIRPVHLGLNVINDEAANTGFDLSLDAYFRFFVLNFEGQLSETELASKLGISRKALWECRQKMDLQRHV